MTRTQARARLNKLYSEGCLGKLNAIIGACIDELDDLISECEETKDEIEPYEGKDDLTEEQEERYSWFDELITDLESLKSDLEDYEGYLGDHQCELEDRC